ncbi:MAG: gliding motility protein [Acidobacteriota bacterium]|nr:gliding motility protein [Acidobacteriota bacterium]
MNPVTPSAAPSPRMRRASAALEALLVAPVDADDPGALGEWLEPILGWLKQPGAGSAAALRLAFFREFLASRPLLAATLAARLRALLGATSAVELFAETGLGVRHNFLGELSDRLAKKILPSVPNDHHLREVISRLLPDEEDADWLESLPAAEVAALFDVVFRTGEAHWDGLHDDLADAADLLAVRVGGLGLAPDVRARADDGTVGASPFLRLPRSVSRVTDAARHRTGSADALSGLAATAREDIAACRGVLEVVTGHLETFGTSMDLVFRIDLLGRALDRLESLFDFLAPGPGALPDGRVLLTALAREGARESGVGGLVSANARLLSRKIIESAGATGEHYITESRAEYRQMWGSAAGGGALMAGTTLVKYILLTLPFAPFFSGFAASVNYAASFLLIQALHFTVATKQPAATAATLASALESRGSDRDTIVDLLARTTRSQLAAIAGNIGMVVPVAVLLGLLWKAASGHAYFTDEEVHHAVETLHPLRSGTIFFAILTGFYLWLSSVIGGWMENWSNYNRLSEAFARSATLGRFVGRDRRAKIAQRFQRNVSGFGSNVSLGFLLGMTPVVASFFGLPLEVRHVTLSSGALALAAVTFPHEAFLNPPFLWAVAGVAAIAFLNFTVSFSLAFTVAARACGLTSRDLRRLVLAVWKAAKETPGRFFLPPSEASEALATPEG